MDENSSVIRRVQNDIKERIAKAIDKAKQKGDIPGYVEADIKIHMPSKPEQGDFTTSVAMALASEMKCDGRSAAGAIVRYLSLEDSWIQRVDIAGPGFLNFFLSTGWLQEAMADIWKKGPLYGSTNYGAGKKVLIEFVSANPTGPLNVVNARAAAIGDCLAALLEASGYEVSREYYINDAGRQVDLLADSLEARYRQQLGQDVPLPEDGYRGDYLIDIANELIEEKGDSLLKLADSERHEWFKRYAVSRIVEGQKQTLLDYGLEYDTWFSEKSLRDEGAPEATLQELAEKGYIYEKDGAKWFRSTEFGDDKDRVVVKSDGEMTYLVPDIAYHKNKFDRGFDHLIDILGPDHHGYVTRLKAGVAALGYPPEKLEVIIAQTVRLVRGNEVVKMSKRGGEFVTMDELLEEAGKDACRFFFLMRAPSSHLDFDLDLARVQSNENPVYYVQYAHARIASIFRQARQEGIVPALGPNEIDFSLLREPCEIQLMKLLAAFPEEVYEIGQAREPNRLINYMMNVASAFHSFYTQCRVLGEDKELSAARLYLARVCQIVLANALRMAGVSAPEAM
ncbi:MAG: arginine--tRNA ligase [Bacillota bacterium]|jgi:arginyl-tRNA synthetase|nr:arginine--tRNA ligase [Candidatus Fermentithermobacillaceae bacterium]HOA71566.1 arginine--tRNA ligase [Bacillota bacterium]HOP70783.1 arginine--tRNA ligase [Bacillota bacterium]HPT36387.1 arginine--tRNA ligase [Bacillota bacterium]HPZ86088.1 arginine--tRNA ligase [Bacillota bacterium]